MPPSLRVAKDQRKQRAYSPVLNRFKGESTFTVEGALALEQEIRQIHKQGEKLFACPYAGCRYAARQKEQTISHLHSLHTKFCYYICPVGDCTFKCTNHSSIFRHCGRIHNCKAPPKSVPDLHPVAHHSSTLMGTTAAHEDGNKAGVPNVPANMPSVPTESSQFVSPPSQIVSSSAAPAALSSWAPTLASSSSSSSPKSRKRRASSTISPPTITTSISRRSVSSASLAAARLPIQPLTPPIQSFTPPIQHIPSSTSSTIWTPLPTDAMAYEQQFNTSCSKPVNAAYNQHFNVTYDPPVDTAYGQPTNAYNMQAVDQSYTQPFDGSANQCMDQVYNSNEAANYFNGAFDNYIELTADVHLDETIDSYDQHAGNHLDQPTNTYEQSTNNSTITHPHEAAYLTYPPSLASPDAANAPRAGYQSSSSVSPVPTSTSLPTPPISMPVPTIPTFDAANAMPSTTSPMPVPFLPLPNPSMSTLGPMPNSTSLPTMSHTLPATSIAPLDAPTASLPFDPRQCSRKFLFDFCDYVFNKPVPEQWTNARQLWNELHSDASYPQSRPSQQSNVAYPRVNEASQQSNATYSQPQDTLENEAALRKFIDKARQQDVPSYASSPSGSSSDGSFPSQPSNDGYVLQNDVPYDPLFDPAFAHVNPDFLLAFWVNTVQPVYRWLVSTNALRRNLTEQDLLKVMLCGN